ncbi:TIGR02234 family membrane protein [Mycolicibacterium komossense]|uniref:TIGR02234 family membrane protein n=1 Tax=Mycolicibacterium komossense TaxID=1779 RepID=A0ABT3CBB0_9MYCO|nr:TIGR02234 family membrane protein [Mycolicibacterium komossense]MCV7226753.1 TIGR02234 family membrane protein [Mycolicibacterium komossense]
MIRVAQALLVVASLALWVGARLPWVVVSSFDGLGQPKSVTLSGGAWSTALLPLALLLLAATVAALAVRGWPLRLLAVLVALVSAATAYLAISQWVIPDVAIRAADLAQISVASLVGVERRYLGAALTLAGALCTLVAAFLLMRSAATGRAATAKYVAPAARRSAARSEIAETPAASSADLSSDPSSKPAMSERMIWDALDEGNDPTDRQPGSDVGSV